MNCILNGYFEFFLWKAPFFVSFGHYKSTLLISSMNWIIYWIKSAQIFLNWIIVWNKFLVSNIARKIELNNCLALNWIKSPRVFWTNEGYKRTRNGPKIDQKRPKPEIQKAANLVNQFLLFHPQFMLSLGQNGVFKLTFRRFTLILGIVMPIMHFFTFLCAIPESSVWQLSW